jgi:nitronate monooxygenase
MTGGMTGSGSLRTPVRDLLGCRYPILQAGMGGVARAELAAAVSEAGGLGCLGMVREPPGLIAREIAAVREHTDRPFGVNLIPSATDPALVADELAVCLEAGVATMVFFWDVVPEAVAAARAPPCPPEQGQWSAAAPSAGSESRPPRDADARTNSGAHPRGAHGRSVRRGQQSRAAKCATRDPVGRRSQRDAAALVQAPARIAWRPIPRPLAQA